MPMVITSGSVLKCVHQGTVQPVPSQSKLTVDGNPVLVMGDVMGVPIAACPVTPAPGVKPCTTAVSMIAGAATKLKVAGKPVLLETANGLTDSVPPGTWMVQSAGQIKLGSV
jgi:hypothetical protein